MGRGRISSDRGFQASLGVNCMDVYILWHVHEMPYGDEDAKLIGVCSSNEDADAAGFGSSSNRTSAISLRVSRLIATVSVRITGPKGM
jgi:hypothetical protein